MDIYGDLINCDEMHYAKVTADTDTAYTAGTVTYLAPVAEIVHDTKTDVAKRYYDGKVRFITNTEGDTEVKMTVSGVPVKLAAELLGKTYDTTKGIMYDNGVANAPWAALSGRMELGDGGYRYFQYLKGKFAKGSETAKTREDKTTASTVDLTYTAVITTHKFQTATNVLEGVKGLFADTTDETFTTASSWFTSVPTPPEASNS